MGRRSADRQLFDGFLPDKGEVSITAMIRHLSRSQKFSLPVSYQYIKPIIAGASLQESGESLSGGNPSMSDIQIKSGIFPGEGIIV